MTHHDSHLGGVERDEVAAELAARCELTERMRWQNLADAMWEQPEGLFPKEML